MPCGIYFADDLKKHGLYWKRPASELIFLKKDDHHSIHSQNLRNETLCKMRQIKIGKTFSEDHKTKIAVARKAYLKAHIETISGSRNGMFGKHHSEEARRKMSEAARRRSLKRRHLLKKAEEEK